MPNVWTHILFGEELLQQAAPSLRWQDPRDRRVFRVGCQGPDPLFYHRFLPWQPQKGMAALAGAMHSSHCGPVLCDFIRGVAGKPLTDPAVAFVLGFLTHHILDRHMHPFVFYKSGFGKFDHQKFEIWMDALIVQRKLGIETWKTPAWRELDAGPSLPASVAELLMTVTRSRYPELTGSLNEEDWQTAYRDMLKGLRFFHDPYGWKRLITGGYIRKLVYPKAVPDVDLLNESRTVWHHPAVPEETYTASIWDMWELALEDGVRVLQAAIACITAEDAAVRDRAWQTLIPALGNISYETGKPCDSGLEIRFVQPIF